VDAKGKGGLSRWWWYVVGGESSLRCETGLKMAGSSLRVARKFWLGV
jgi:hypothetical protein